MIFNAVIYAIIVLIFFKKDLLRFRATINNTELQE